ncbi:hypothetical protein M2D63_024445 [Pseudomonas sp. BJa5]|uniref:hypothetical protein n=1 Tax=Pseudomonas sp. BJa5 TaxID=2936270 RepID=UPI002559DEDB|nr:hypothetical protein [Pseudomonas sp. BGr12]MDL2424267.1 hypothetical protein [Pseudomonas sp. BGr12]
MSFRALTYDVFHLGLYMIAVLAWTTLCVMLLLKVRRQVDDASARGCLYVGAVGACVCLGLLLADVLRLVDDSVVLVGLLVFGAIVPGMAITVLYVRLRTQGEKIN